MHKNKYKNLFRPSRFIFFAEVPQFNEAELVAVKTAKGDEQEELKTSDLIAAVNGEIGKHKSQLGELPQDYNDQLHNEIRAYLLRSPGRFDQDQVKGLNAQEFQKYVGAMQTKTQEFMAEYAPTAEDIQKKKDLQEKAKSTKERAEKVQPKEEQEKILSGDPAQITTLDGLEQAFTAYNEANAELQKDATAVFQPAIDFHKSYAEFKKTSEGLRAYKKFSAYLFPEDDPERIKIQESLENTKSKIVAAKTKFSANKEKLKAYGEKLGNVSNTLKQAKLEERNRRMAQLDDKSEGAEQKKDQDKEQYQKLSLLEQKLIARHEQIDTYRENVKASKEAQEKNGFDVQEKRSRLDEFQENIEDSVAALDEALKNENLTPEQKQKLEESRTFLVEKHHAADLGMKVLSGNYAESQKNILTLSQGDRSLAAQSVNVQQHLNDQVTPGLQNLEKSISTLDDARMKFSTDKEEVAKYYDQTFKNLDEIDAGVDGAILQNNLSNNQIEQQLDQLGKGLDKIDLSVPSGLGGAFNTGFGFITGTLSGGIGFLGEKISDAGKWILNQGEWLTDIVDNNKDSLGLLYYPAKYVFNPLAFAIGTAGGLIEMGGGVVNLVAHPLSTLGGMASLIGRDPQSGEWSASTAGNAWKGMGKATIMFEDFQRGHYTLALGKMFPNIVLTIQSMGSVQAGKIAAQAAYATARGAGAGAGRAFAKGTVAFGKEAVKDIAKDFKSMKTFIVGAEGEGNVVRRLAKGTKTFVQGAEGQGNIIQRTHRYLLGAENKAGLGTRLAQGVKQAPGALLEGVKAAPSSLIATTRKLYETVMAQAEKLWNGKIYENVRLRDIQRKGLGLRAELEKSSPRYEEYTKRASERKAAMTDTALTEAEKEAMARAKLIEEDADLVLDAYRHEKTLKELAEVQDEFGRILEAQNIKTVDSLPDTIVAPALPISEKPPVSIRIHKDASGHAKTSSPLEQPNVLQVDRNAATFRPPGGKKVALQRGAHGTELMPAHRNANHVPLAHEVPSKIAPKLSELKASNAAEAAESFKKLGQRLDNDPILRKRFEDGIYQYNKGQVTGVEFIEFKDLSRILTSQEIKMLAEADIPLSINFIRKVIAKEYGIISDGKSHFLSYSDEAAVLGEGGFGKVMDCYFVPINEQGMISGPLRKEAVKFRKKPETPNQQALYQIERDVMEAVNNLSPEDKRYLVQLEFAGEHPAIPLGRDRSGNIIVSDGTALITQKINPFEGLNGQTGLQHVLVNPSFPPTVDIRCLRDGLQGIQAFNTKVGRVHLDIKPPNLYAKKDGVTVLGDLGGISLNDLSLVEFLGMPKAVRLSNGKTVHVQFPCIVPEEIGSHGGIGLPVTPEYYAAGYSHFQLQVELAKLSRLENIPVPPSTLASLTDVGQYGYMLLDYRACLEFKLQHLPGKAKEPILKRLDHLIGQIDDLPDIEVIQNYRKAVKNNDHSLASTLKGKVNGEFDKLKNRITIDQIDKELDAISQMIEAASSTTLKPDTVRMPHPLEHDTVAAPPPNFTIQ